MNDAQTSDTRTTTQPVTVKTSVDEFLGKHFDSRIESSAEIEPSYAYLWQTIKDLALAGGKRLRPYMTLVTYQAYAAKSFDDILPAAAAEELLHLAMLIHDDIIDRDDIRYGVKNVAGTFYDHYETLIPKESERRHFANSAAILAGDLLISEASFLLTQLDHPIEDVRRVQALFHEAIFGVVGGELLDTEASFKKLAGAHPSIIAEYKTSSYSFVMPLLVGAVLAKAPAADQQLLRALATRLGIAYQMRDDVLGIFGDPALTGKSADSDIVEGKRTLLTDEFLRRATDEQKQLYSLVSSAAATASDITSYRAALRESGTLESIEQQIQSHLEACLVMIDQLQINDNNKAAYRELADMCLHRQK